MVAVSQAITSTSRGRNSDLPLNEIHWFLLVHCKNSNKMALVKSLGRLASARSLVFVCDMQEKFKPTIRYFPEIAVVAARMVCFNLR